MNICVIGSGYVGLVTGTCFAEMGNKVWCVDIDEEKIQNLKRGVIPIYEPGLQEMVQRNCNEKRLFFTNSFADGLNNALFCFIAVGTPSNEDGSADLVHVLNVADMIGAHMTKYQIVVNKSTVPVGTAQQVRDRIFAKLYEKNMEMMEFDVVSNPEFLKEGAAIEDFMRPDRIIVGTDTPRAADMMKQLYEPFVRNQHPIYFMDICSAEMSKYAANAMLATRISFMNEIARLCDRLGADIANVRLGIGSDSRIGMSFLYAGIGYGGSCFPKDVKALIHMGKEQDVVMEVISAVESVNQRQKKCLVELIYNRFGTDLKNITIGLWGLAFKPQTDDMREAPAVVIVNELLGCGAKIIAYDPQAIPQAKKIFCDPIHLDRIFYVKDLMQAIEQVDALILVTEWRQFRQPDFEQMKLAMKQAVIFDGRNQYDPTQMYELGFEYYCIGRNNAGGTK